MLPWLMVLQALVTLWLAWCCWRYARNVIKDNAALWSGLAELRMHHNELEHATDLELTAIHDRFDDLDDGDIVNVTPPPKCQCANCRKRRQLEVN